MKVSEFIKSIKKQGIKFKHHNTKHDVYINPKTGGIARVPRHKSKDLKKGTIDGILKQLGLK